MATARTLYSGTYKCLTLHGTVIHSRQVEWITDAKLSMFPDISQESTVEALEKSMQATSPGVDLFARHAPPDKQSADALDPTYGTAVLRVDAGKLYRSDIDGSLRCRRQYVAGWVLQHDSLCVAGALKTHYNNAKGESKRYTHQKYRVRK